jgi:hypothetical protein
MEHIMTNSKSNVDQVYSGKHGCMCGCRGNYHKEGAMVTRLYNKVMGNPAHEEHTVTGCHYAVLKTETRNYVVYFKD